MPFVLLLKFGTFSSQLRNAVFSSTRSIRWTSTKLVRRLFFRLYMLICFVSLLFRHQRLPSSAYTNKPRWIPIKFAEPRFFSQNASALHIALLPPPPSPPPRFIKSELLCKPVHFKVCQYFVLPFVFSFLLQ